MGTLAEQELVRTSYLKFLRRRLTMLIIQVLTRIALPSRQ